MYLNLQNDEYFVVFYSHNHTTFLYNKIKEKGFEIELMSTPCSVSAGCSQCIKFMGKDLKLIKEVIKNNDINIKALYKIEYNNGKTRYLQLYKRT